VTDKIKYCIDVILKEAKLEDRLVKQIFYTMLSAYTSNPQNLGINSPSGEGKNYVLRKVAENFPKEDVMFLAGMTDKALFHRVGELVIKNEIGGYDPIEGLIKEYDSRIEDIRSEMSNTKDRLIKQALKAQIKTVEEAKKDLYKDARKLIDLSHKILIFLDTPRSELFNAIMSLLSHDNYEVEYEYADTTNNGIKTKVNVIRGYPAVIFAQALDFSDYKRYPEIQRRFIITNPKMTADKYKEAISLIGKKFGLPDFMYQLKVVSNLQKEKVREIIKGLRENILNVCGAIEPGSNNVIIPFDEVITESLRTRSTKAQDMTIAHRLFSYLSLLPIINIDKRPRIVYRKKGEPITQVMPFASYDDLGEAMYLMQYANGVRPYILDWYYSVFLKTYNSKTEPDFKTDTGGKEREVIKEEDIIAVTSRELVNATKEIQNKSFTIKKILQTYIEPLMNEGYIDKQESNINHRNNIYYPIVLDSEGEPSLFRSDEKDQKRNKEQEISRVKVSDFTLNPTSEYIKGKVGEVVSCSSETDLFCKIFDSNDNEITIDDLVTNYVNAEQYFQFKQNQEVWEEQENEAKTGENTRETDENPCSHEEKRNKEQQKENDSITFSCNYCAYETTSQADYDKHSADIHPPITTIRDSIYRLGSSDTWACHNCKIRADRWFMQVHDCKG
jgi:hypothetical protein